MNHFQACSEFVHSQPAANPEWVLPVVGLFLTILIFLAGQFFLQKQESARHLDAIESWERYMIALIERIIPGARQQMLFYAEFQKSLDEHNLSATSLSIEPRLDALNSIKQIPEDRILDRLVNWREGRSVDKLGMLTRVKALLDSIAGNHSRAYTTFERYLEEMLRHQANWAIQMGNLNIYIDSLRPPVNQLMTRGATDAFSIRVLKSAEEFAASMRGEAASINSTTPYMEKLRAIVDEFPSDPRSSTLFAHISRVELIDSMATSLLQYTSRNIGVLSKIVHESTEALAIEMELWKGLAIIRASKIVEFFRTNKWQ